MNALRTSGIEPGRDVGVVGTGGTDEAAAFHPALTTVLDNPAKIGRMAVERGLLPGVLAGLLGRLPPVEPEVG